MKKIFLVLFLSSVIFLFIFGFSLAQRKTEINYPEIDSIRPISVKTPLPKYMKYVFTFFVIVSGIGGFGALIYGGIRFLTSTGSPGARKEAQSQILAAMGGIALLLGAYLVSKTINPQLTIPQASLTYTGGVLLGTEACDEKGRPGGETKGFMIDSPNLGTMEDGTTPFVARSLKILSSPGEVEVIVWRLENYNNEGGRVRISDDVTTCVNSDENGWRSIKFLWRLPGVYLCTGIYEWVETVDGHHRWQCRENEKYLPADTALLESELNDNVEAIRLKPSYKIKGPFGQEAAFDVCNMLAGNIQEREDGFYCIYPDQYFGAVIHEGAAFTGQCSLFQGKGWEFAKTLPNGTESPDLTDWQKAVKKNKASSVTVFSQPSTTDLNYPLGGGVWLCDYENDQKEDCHGPFGINGPEYVEYVRDVGIDNDSITSIIIEGNYMAILFDGGDDQAYRGTCEVFVESDSNFRDNPIGRCDCISGNWGCTDCLSSFIVLPLKGVETGAGPGEEEEEEEECEDTCSPPNASRCRGNDLQSCEDHDDDGCLEWETIQDCSEWGGWCTEISENQAICESI